jgi:hypothetical protein
MVLDRMKGVTDALTRGRRHAHPGVCHLDANAIGIVLSLDICTRSLLIGRSGKLAWEPERSTVIISK